jgi:hypothetical protein
MPDGPPPGPTSINSTHAPQPVASPLCMTAPACIHAGAVMHRCIHIWHLARSQLRSLTRRQLGRLLIHHIGRRRRRRRVSGGGGGDGGGAGQHRHRGRAARQPAGGQPRRFLLAAGLGRLISQIDRAAQRQRSAETAARLPRDGPTGGPGCWGQPCARVVSTAGRRGGVHGCGIIGKSQPVLIMMDPMISSPRPLGAPTPSGRATACAHAPSPPPRRRRRRWCA